MSGLLSHLKGAAAESAVARHYGARGGHLVAERWRGAHGEVDLIFQEGETLVFVEVKSSRTIDRALAALGVRQIRRLIESASDLLASSPLGQSTPMRFDVAAMDGQGRMEIVENALCA